MITTISMSKGVMHTLITTISLSKGVLPAVCMITTISLSKGVLPVVCMINQYHVHPLLYSSGKGKWLVAWFLKCIVCYLFHLCVCVCVWERESKRERERARSNPDLAPCVSTITTPHPLPLFPQDQCRRSTLLQSRGNQSSSATIWVLPEKQGGAKRKLIKDPVYWCAYVRSPASPHVALPLCAWRASIIKVIKGGFN